MPRRYFAALVSLLLFPWSVIAQEKELNPLEVFDRTLAAFDNQRVALRDYQYYQTLTTHQFDSSGSVTARGTWQSIVRPCEERFFSLLAGKLWIAKNDFIILKMDVALQSPCQLFWIFAQVTTFKFTYILEPSRGPRLFRLSKATAKTLVSFPFYNIRQKHWLTIDKYEPRTPRGTAPKNSRPSLSPRGGE